MPFIRGRYHINPIMGEALEAARAAEEERLAAEHESGDSAHDQADGFASPHDAAHPAPGTVHRIEIEASQLTPAYAGRAQRGFVARVHRYAGSSAHGAPPETHAFTDHRDLVQFLHHELSK